MFGADSSAGPPRFSDTEEAGRMQQKEAPEVLRSKGITEETVRDLSSFKDEPD